MEKMKTVMCCFCGKSLAHKDSIEITISKVNSQELQSIFSHGKCLNKVLDKSVPIGIELDNEK